MFIKEKNFQEYFDLPIEYTRDLLHKGNNRLFLITLKNKKEYLLKEYSKLHMDNFQRGKTESSALKFLWEKGFKEIPEVILFDEKNNIGIYSFEKGIILKPSEVREENIISAVNFLVKLHNLEDKENFAPASSACLSFKDYLDVIDRRLAKMDLTGENESEKKALDFLNNEVIPKIEEIKADFLKKVEENGFDINKQLSIKEQVLTPADFGFHNILVDGKNHKFLDFEYFGRDDPARQILDFFYHAKSDDLSLRLKELFIKNYCEKRRLDENFKKRIELLSPLIQVTWVLICLNILSKNQLEHLKFAQENIDNIIEERMENAKKKLNQINQKI